MNAKLLLLVGVIFLLVSAVSWNNKRQQYLVASHQSEPQESIVTNSPTNCVPTFADGGGPYYQPDSPFRENIAPEIHNGTNLVVTGKVLKQDCVTPLSGGILDIWQANESGNYEDEWYRGQIIADDQGNYRFTTVVPQGYGSGTGYRPPHIHFKVFEGTREIITSQMFLPAAREQQIDEAYIVDLEEREENGEKIFYATHDIVVPE